jgi:hypothetical protein
MIAIAILRIVFQSSPRAIGIQEEIAVLFLFRLAIFFVFS